MTSCSWGWKIGFVAVAACCGGRCYSEKGIRFVFITKLHHHHHHSDQQHHTGRQASGWQTFDRGSRLPELPSRYEAWLVCVLEVLLVGMKEADSLDVFEEEFVSSRA